MLVPYTDGLGSTGVYDQHGNTITVPGTTGDWWPQTYWTQPCWPTVVYTQHEYPRECVGDIHVFGCPHCDKCKCGKATVKREKKARG